MKSERLKKYENELHDLEHWLNLGLVPKKDIPKHKEEITALKKKIEEEENRLRYLKESGENEEYAAPKKSAQGRPAYQETHTLPDVGMSDEGMTDAGLDAETEYDSETTVSDATEEKGEEATVIEEDEEDPFSDKSRWRRGILEDPDSDNW